jgi:hypothetical protein
MERKWSYTDQLETKLMKHGLGLSHFNKPTKRNRPDDGFDDV